MVDLNDAFLEGISDLDCDKQMGNFLKKVLKFELSLNEKKNLTQTNILDQYKSWVENFSEGE